jgi:hypothetical protein
MTSDLSALALHMAFSKEVCLEDVQVVLKRKSRNV